MNFDPTHKGHYRMWNSMFAQIKPWAKEDGDALWRTAQAYFTYEDELLLKGIKRCLVWDGEKLKVYRYPGAPDNCSRDSVAMVAVVLRLMKHKELMKLFKKLPWKISEEHNMTIDLWLWIHLPYLWQLVATLQMLFVIPWNAYWRNFMKKRDNWILEKLLFPHYAFYIFCWQVYVSPRTPLRWLLRRLCRLEAEKDNHVIRLLLGAAVTVKPTHYKPVHGFRWPRRLDEPHDDLWIKNTSGEKINNLDIDLFKKLYQIAL